MIDYCIIKLKFYLCVVMAGKPNYLLRYYSNKITLGVSPWYD